ncbi:MAG: RdgB/HAM1 family non-canonical purine NTP pyrophosphatase [Bacilli bacterium]|nr:RdgB/HAM1 family non-canonical purine NTP pyrophosphatase [Bacilli bacterium]
MKTLVLATNNQHKVREYNEMLQPIGYEVKTLKELGIKIDPEENGTTYAENAYIKCKATRELVDLPVISDDSGIEIKAYGTFPGIFSSRFIDEQCEGSYEKGFVKINEMLEGKEDRRAEYHCAICLLEERDGEPHVFEGICEGVLLHEPHGTGGFGYDPLFHCTETDQDFGTCTEDEKNAVSHRKKALLGLLKYLNNK